MNLAPVSKAGAFLFVWGTNFRFPFLIAHEGRGSLRAPMADHRPRSSYESDNVPWSKAVARRVTLTTIGQELKALFQVPQDLPDRMRTLLKRLNARHEEE
jgi:hypothetical protein